MYLFFCCEKNDMKLFFGKGFNILAIFANTPCILYTGSIACVREWPLSFFPLLTSVCSLTCHFNFLFLQLSYRGGWLFLLGTFFILLALPMVFDSHLSATVMFIQIPRQAQCSSVLIHLVNSNTIN